MLCTYMELAEKTSTRFSHRFAPQSDSQSVDCSHPLAKNIHTAAHKSAAVRLFAFSIYQLIYINTRYILCMFHVVVHEGGGVGGTKFSQKYKKAKESLYAKRQLQSLDPAT